MEQGWNLDFIVRRVKQLMGLKDMVCSRKLKVKFYEIICKSVTIHSEL
jgi:hypothetical protein